MHSKRSLRIRWVAAVGVLLGLATIAADVAAIIGRPATPMSYAGVARRSARRY
jgi:hypothetical protein